ncbi:hypothetical protein [Schaalia sp. ZJ405]|uniref:hypothetical protein n=1 Tax=Schaalia sp. ZJ405 TaxID=2709403 RepID=UPI001E4276FF|nr:hypothetical protein [Schaalia sp. ZJ405]
MKHIGSAHDDSELALLKAQAQRFIDGDQLVLDLGLGGEWEASGIGSKGSSAAGEFAEGWGTAGVY